MALLLQDYTCPVPCCELNAPVAAEEEAMEDDSGQREYASALR